MIHNLYKLSGNNVVHTPYCHATHTTQPYLDCYATHTLKHTCIAILHNLYMYTFIDILN